MPRGQRIFIGFLVYTLISFAVATICFWLFRRVESISILADNVHQLHLDIHKLSKLKSDFILHESIDTEFFSTGKSVYFNEYTLTQKGIRKKINTIKESKQADKWEMQNDLRIIENQIKINLNLMNQLSLLILRRGYKHHGMEGKMRDYAHQIEAIEALDKFHVLQLRRYEKDFINRLDSSALLKWRDHYELLQNEIYQNKKLSKIEKDSANQLLSSYHNHFEKFTQLDRNIGHRNNTGMTLRINEQSDVLLQQMNDLDKYAQVKKDKILNQLRIITVIVVTASVIMSMMLGLAFPYIMKTK